MAWQTPPTFADGDYLTAAKLNILSDNTEHLRGIVYQVNTGFYVRDIECSSAGFIEVLGWACKHYSDVFRYWMTVEAGSVDDVRIYAGSNSSDELFRDTGVHNAGYTYGGTNGISGLALTPGDVYTITVKVRGKNVMGDRLRVWYLGEDW